MDGSRCSLPYAMVVPRDHFCHPDDAEPVFIGQPEWGRFQSSSMNTLPFTETECITNCTELLHSVNCVPDVFLMTPIRDDIMNQTVTWTRNFASHVEKNLEIAQSGYVALKNILRSRNPQELQNFANKFVNSVTSTLDQWRNSHTTMEKVISAATCVCPFAACYLQMYLEYHTSLRTKPRRLCWWLKRDKVEKRLCKEYLCQADHVTNPI
ncbi:hypothetical protein EDD16DRAFT_603037 [Pisolithus croceorrhizus]|nr:hypothetical protein EDD16DRAFT_603037 [Pisolithus croceorrhizus]